MSSVPYLDDAILLAAQSHRGRTDKAGHAYILHVLRVMFRLDSDEQRIVGVLHDIVEETDVTLDRLKSMGYSDKIVEALELLTWRKGQHSYDEYIKRLKTNELAARVKRADIADHLAPAIDSGPTWLQKNHPELYERYQKALLEV
jgi:(p)ppGpp synthase/HD superfamily hydrolase